MNKWLYTAIFIIIFITAMCILYRSGLLISKSIRAVLFAFLPGKNTDRVSLDSCTGWISRTIRFHTGGIYEFTLESGLRNGSVEVRLTDSRKQPVLVLTQQSPSGVAELKEKQHCRLRWEFKSASGKCELRWQRRDTVQPHAEVK